MRILIISEKDAANASLSVIADELMARKHEIEIYAVYNATNTLRFFDTSIPVRDFFELTKEKAESFDCILTTSVVAVSLQNGEIISSRIPIYTQNYLVNGQVYWRGDLCFVPSLETTETEYMEYMLGGRLGIGEPKYDSKSRSQKDSNKLLFLDSGHFPFGDKGRMEVAETIIKIAKAFPEYEVVVKPRFLQDDEVVTHKNRLHLYDVIEQHTGGVLPSNLTLLKEHLDLETLIEDCHTMICMYTTAFVGACINKKGLVVLDDIPSVDVYDTRYKTSLRIRNHMMKSGAVVNYKEVLSVLPDGIVVGDDYIKYLLAEEGNSAFMICDVIEYLQNEFYSKGKFPELADLSMKDIYMVQEKPDWNWAKQIDLRYRDYLIQRMVIHIDFHVKARLDINQYIADFLPEGLIDFETYQRLLPTAFSIRNRCIVDNYDRMLMDEIDQGILLNSLYSLGRYEDIHGFPNDKTGAYHYFSALAYNCENQIIKCIEHLLRYDEISYGRDYILEISDMPNNRFGAYALLINNLIAVKDTDKAIHYLKKLERIYLDNYRVSKLMEPCKTKGQYRQLTTLMWVKAELENLFSKKWDTENLYIYGAGEICKDKILKKDLIARNVKVIVDKFSNEKEINGIPVVRPEDIRKLQTGIVVITVPEQAETIKNELLKYVTNMDIYSILDLLSGEQCCH